MPTQQQTVLEEGTEQFERFVDIPQPIMFKVFVFNVTNPNEVIEGAVPKVKEIGPYVYKYVMMLGQQRNVENPIEIGIYHFFSLFVSIFIK